MSGSSEWSAWGCAKSRCYRRSDPQWKNYGGRGITMCDAWRNDVGIFLRDMGPRPEGYSLDRINNDGPYAPGNCRWATPKQQSNNTRRNRVIEFRGERHNVTEWAAILNLNYGLLKRRLGRGWSTERALTQPARC
jgi:hypothetical protein